MLGVQSLQEKNTSYSAHARLSLGQITLKSYRETGGVAAITYSDQDIDYQELVTGVEMSEVMKWNSFHIRPHTTIKYSHSLNKSSPAAMHYVSSSTVHTSVVKTEMQSGWSINAGMISLTRAALVRISLFPEANPIQIIITIQSILVFNIRF